MKYILITITTVFLAFSTNAQIDYNNTTTNGLYGSAIGNDNDADGDHAFAGGWNSKAQMHNTFAFGNTAISQGNQAIAYGTGTTSLG
jgi:hypothetical protein